MGQGRFITIEGGEGVGKTSLIQALSGYFTSKGVQHLLTREPGGTPAADQLREVFLAPAETLVPLTEVFILSAARAQHVATKILPALQAGSWVICDRYTDSLRVYQGVMGRVDPKTIDSIIDISTGSLAPELTILVDCDIAVSVARVEARHSSTTGKGSPKSRFDSKTMKFHQSVRQGFLALAEQYPERFLVVDGSDQIDSLIVRISRDLERRRWITLS